MSSNKEKERKQVLADFFSGRKKAKRGKTQPTSEEDGKPLPWNVEDAIIQERSIRLGAPETNDKEIAKLRELLANAQPKVVSHSNKQQYPKNTRTGGTRRKRKRRRKSTKKKRRRKRTKKKRRKRRKRTKKRRRR